ncbi:MAG: hypothetical protein D6720_10860 [Gammaproteobacteria bacterium]|nr:MAG: hypothetical protein D6720_10860 [Gammaproteobacteria bacterium]
MIRGVAKNSWQLGGVVLKRLGILVLLMWVGAVAFAGSHEVAGVSLPLEVRVEGIAEPLRLNGAGVRSKFFFKIYVAALYLEHEGRAAEEILRQLPAYRLAMHFLYHEVSREKLDEGWEEGFRANLSTMALTGLRERLERFKRLFATLHEGDVVWLDHIPGQGTRVSINGRFRGLIEGDDFSRALLSVWLGRNPVTESLKKALLSAATPL